VHDEKPAWNVHARGQEQGRKKGNRNTMGGKIRNVKIKATMANIRMYSFFGSLFSGANLGEK
jgi:hypothetical protein